MQNSQPASKWVICPTCTSQVPLRLFCFPYAGGGASIFRDWSTHLSAQAEICPMQLPGRENRLQEAPVTQMHILIESLASALLPYINEKPFALFGHSMGALLCYEVARLLATEYALSPVCLFVSGSCAPQCQNLSSKASRKRVSDLSDAALMEWVCKLNGTSPIILQDNELMQLLLPAIRADFTLAETYTYVEGNTLNCPLSVFGGTQDEDVQKRDLLAWLELTSGPSVVRMLPGNHFFLQTAQPLLLNAIQHDLASFA